MTMGKTLLFLRLEGPMQSWGLRSRWDTRDTGEEPSKSGVIGLLGAALGYGRGDPRLAELDGSLRLGVRVEQSGSRAVDFQTVTGKLPTADGGAKGSRDDPSTIVSPREYLQDAAFLVVLDGPEETLRRCERALRNPRWPIYLGRKGCPPARPVLEGTSERYVDIEDALRHHPWDWEGREVLRETPQELRCSLEDATGNASRPDSIRPGRARMYGRRQVRVFAVSSPETQPQDPARGG